MSVESVPDRRSAVQQLNELVGPSEAKPARNVPARLRSLLAAGGPRNTIVENTLFLLGAASVDISAVIHLHLWMTGYSGIRIIGPLFLVQSIAGLAIAVLLVLFRRLWAAAVGFGYLVATIAGFLLSVDMGLFGFQDTWSAPFATAAFWDEVAGAVLVLGTGVSCLIRRPGGPPGAMGSRRGRPALRAEPAMSVTGPHRPTPEVGTRSGSRAAAD